MSSCHDRGEGFLPPGAYRVIFAAYVICFIIFIFIKSKNMRIGMRLQPAGDGRPYFAKVKNVGKHATHRQLVAGFMLTNSRYFVIRRERWYHKFLKSFGLATEMQLEDEGLDNALYIATDAPDHLAAKMKSDKFKQALRTLFLDEKVKEVRAYNNRVWLVGPVVTAAAFAPLRLRAGMLDIAEAIDSDAQSADMMEFEPMISARRCAVAFMVLHAPLFFLGITAGLPLIIENTEIVSQWQMVTMAAVFAALACGVWLFSIIVLTGRSSWLPLVIADFFLFGIIGIFLTSYFAMREINIRLDHRAPALYAQDYMYKTCTLHCKRGSGKHSRSETYTIPEAQCTPQTQNATRKRYEAQSYICASSNHFSYKIAIKPWNKNQGSYYSFSTDYGMYVDARKGDSYEVTAHTGFLGVDWVDTDEIHKARQ